ncbi:Protein of unknown function [Flavobacterium indicum GPTSA100-9 = DSM 17447]|uniref:Uncharacterized protein n=1 Tax=Flavobacterium indicum (strain DSM 17447 / CIP 109464 / GPTSA100-9) TaxID=1094466 RepID=H8XTA3_FLAIG|nr:hypothetical protein [Flavobacterium indicum]CCG52700.1 Protein of unknown function [Flavobacterium indicum GPTSA100-9 = DSM 17447]
MNKKIKLIWDFRGATAAKTAEHHEIHLKEFIQTENYSLNITGFEIVNEMYALAYLVVEENDMIKFRDLLKPHRGEYYE